jgi:hypothetical protein
MNGPIVFISTHRLKEGGKDGVKKMTEEVLPALEAGKPRTVFQHFYLSEDGTRLKAIHIFPDAEAMDLHVVGADERAGHASEFMEPEGYEVYGTPSEGFLGVMDRMGGAALLTVWPGQLGGYMRLGGEVPMA